MFPLLTFFQKNFFSIFREVLPFPTFFQKNFCYGIDPPIRMSKYPLYKGGYGEGGPPTYGYREVYPVISPLFPSGSMTLMKTLTLVFGIMKLMLYLCLLNQMIWKKLITECLMSEWHWCPYVPYSYSSVFWLMTGVFNLIVVLIG